MSYPGQCSAGNPVWARTKWSQVLHSPDYGAFLEYMCPGSAAAGRFPPTGTDPRVCPRAITGVYDDHDWGWNNGNSRLPHKDEFKEMYLDAIGEPVASPRRGGMQGIQGKVVLNGGAPGRDIDVLLLDERWYREPLPCQLRRKWCTDQLASNPSHAFCSDFLLDDGAIGVGSCCRKDEQLEAWCGLASSTSHPLWRQACDPTSAEWASSLFMVASDNVTLLVPDDTNWGRGTDMATLVQASTSPVCEVLGMKQRAWLQAQLQASSAPLKLVASGSVLLPNIGFSDSRKGVCGDDDWGCYQPAQLNLVHTLANVSTGCVVVLVGDFHFSDLKVVAPPGAPGANASAPYVQLLQAHKMSKHVYQVMSSGMSTSTAGGGGAACEGTYRGDVAGLRPLGSCSIVQGPSFGTVDVDWDARTVTLALRREDGGSVATGDGGRLQQLTFSLDTCAPLPG